MTHSLQQSSVFLTFLPSVSGQQPVTEPEKPLDPQTEEDSDSSIDISSLHLNQTKVLGYIDHH